MENYRDTLILNYFMILDIRESLFKFGMDLCMLDELKDLQDDLKEGIELPVDILDTMKDPMVKRIAETLYKINLIGETVFNINAFTDEELQPGGYEEIPGPEQDDNPIKARYNILDSLVTQHYNYTINVTRYLNEMCYANGYKEYIEDDFDNYCFECYGESDYGDVNINLISSFYRHVNDLVEYIEEQELYSVILKRVALEMKKD